MESSNKENVLDKTRISEDYLKQEKTIKMSQLIESVLKKMSGHNKSSGFVLPSDWKRRFHQSSS